MKRHDIIVVGAGPAGSTAAYRLAKAGASVLLLDRARFPRDKPCGGGVTGRAARLLPFSIEPVVEHVVSAVDLACATGDSWARQRTAARLHDTAEAARPLPRREGRRSRRRAPRGRQGRRAGGGRGRRLRQEFEALALVGADGVNGVTARALGLGGNRVVGVALEGNLSLREDGSDGLRRPARSRAWRRPGRLRLGLPQG
jgi:flavin-dependent dehydrogenase